MGCESTAQTSDLRFCAMTEKGPGQLTLRTLLFLNPKCGQCKPTCNTFKRAQVFGSREHQISIYEP